MEEKSKVYIQIGPKNWIIRCEGGYTMGNISNIEEWLFIDEGYGDKYNLCQSHYFDGGIYTDDGICRYVWEGESYRLRTDEEMEADRQAPVDPEPVEPEPPPDEYEARIAALEEELEATKILLGVE